MDSAQATARAREAGTSSQVDGAGDVNGQVFVVIGGDVWVMNGWSIAGHLHKDGPWTPEELAAKKDELFADQDRTLPQMAVPSW